MVWQRDTSGECPDEDEDSTTITDGSTSYDIMGLEEDSSYSITVTASNAADSRAVSNTVTAMTLESGKITIERGNPQTIYHLPSTAKVLSIWTCFKKNIFSSISSSHFCENIQ